MSDNFSEALPWATIAAQPSDVRGLSDSERDKLIITATHVDGKWIIQSQYGDDIWQLTGFPNNVPISKRQINFGTVSPTFRAAMKAIFYRYLRRGRSGNDRPKGATVCEFFNGSLPFLRHLEALKATRLGEANPMIAASYVATCKAHLQMYKRKPLSQRALQARYVAVETLYELSQYTNDSIPEHPWPDTSAWAMAGRIGVASGGRTPLIPDNVFCTLFEQAHQQVERGKSLLDLRDDLDAIAAADKGQTASDLIRSKNRHLQVMGWVSGLRAFNRSLLDLRTACYIVLASTSGCRNHELANLQSGAHHRTEDDEGAIYHWMRSTSEKTDVGTHDWMIPELAVRAIRVMELWAEPYQKMIANEIVRRRRINTQDPQIAEAYKHRHSLFLGLTSKSGNIRTLSAETWNDNLNAFAKGCGLSWKLSTHQFRRKFANYAAHSRFGDLRYLKEHFAHWSLDMTLGYAMDESWGQHFDLDLYVDIKGELEDIKLGVVEDWIPDGTKQRHDQVGRCKHRAIVLLLSHDANHERNGLSVVELCISPGRRPSEPS
ncbi:integrase [Pseudomonas syringae]|uniref:integrase n=1 Tax=Pseudomonas syringae TaxID=317 RepID=UPI001BCFC99C|nr:integrase [Pseudomonas syringae]MBS7473997.1 integrase [Pseudomonas syringae]